MSRHLKDRIPLLFVLFLCCLKLSVHPALANAEGTKPNPTKVSSTFNNMTNLRGIQQQERAAPVSDYNDEPEITLLETMLLWSHDFARRTWNKHLKASVNYDRSLTYVNFKNHGQLRWEQFVTAYDLDCPDITTSHQSQHYNACLEYHGFHIDRVTNKDNTLNIYVSEYIEIKDATLSDLTVSNTPVAAYLYLLLQPYSGPNLNPGQLRVNLKEFEYKKIGYKPQADFFKNEDNTYDTSLKAQLHDDKISAAVTYDMNRDVGVSASARWLTNIVAPGRSSFDIVYHKADDEIFTSFYTPIHQFKFSTLEATASYSNSSVLEAHNVELGSVGLNHTGRIYRYSDPDVIYNQKFFLKNEQVRNNLSPEVNYAQYGLRTIFKNSNNKRDQVEANISIISTYDELEPILSSGLELKTQEKFEFEDIKFNLNTQMSVRGLFSNFSRYPISERLSLGGEDTVRGVSNSLFGSRENPQDTGAEFVAALQNEIEFPFKLKKKLTSVGLLNDYGVVDRGYGAGDLLVSLGLFGRYQLSDNVMASLEITKNFNVNKILHVGFSLKTLF